MVLNGENIFVTDLFKSSPEDDSVMVWDGNKWIPTDFNSAVYATDATVADFQANAATGTMNTPAQINDNNTASASGASVIGEYAEVDFGKSVKILRYRQFGEATNNGDGTWKIQYYTGGVWADWKTGIATRAAESWAGFDTVSEVVTTKIRLVCTAVDSCTISFINELEVIY